MDSSSTLAGHTGDIQAPHFSPKKVVSLASTVRGTILPGCGMGSDLSTLLQHWKRLDLTCWRMHALLLRMRKTEGGAAATGVRRKGKGNMDEKEDAANVSGNDEDKMQEKLGKT